MWRSTCKCCRAQGLPSGLGWCDDSSSLPQVSSAFIHSHCLCVTQRSLQADMSLKTMHWSYWVSWTSVSVVTFVLIMLFLQGLFPKWSVRFTSRQFDLCSCFLCTVTFKLTGYPQISCQIYLLSVQPFLIFFCWLPVDPQCMSLCDTGRTELISFVLDLTS